MLIYTGSLIFAIGIPIALGQSMLAHMLKNESYVPPKIVSRVHDKPFRKCWPTIMPEPVQVDSVPANGRGRWWQVTFHPATKQDRLFFYTGKDREGVSVCSWLNRDKTGNRTSLMPLYAATGFARQHYQGILDKCEKEAEASEKDKFCHGILQKELNVHRPYVQREDFEVLKDLKFDVSNIKVYEQGEDGVSSLYP